MPCAGVNDMRVMIDAPTVRALSANEQRVYKLLRQGDTPKDIAAQLHILLGSADYIPMSIHDVLPDTVVGLITSIREKGWDIPSDKEENEMAKSPKFSAEEKRSIVTEYNSGATMAQVAEKHGTVKSTVYNIVQEYKKHGEAAFEGAEAEKEPATAATVTSSEQETCDNIPADIVSPSEENVKTIPLAVREACQDKIDYLNGEIAAEQAVIDEWKAQIAEIKNFLGGETI
jgi:transposase-like protein